MNHWDERYGGSGYYYGTEPNEFLRDHAAAIPAGGKVLSLGEGEGRNAAFLAARGYRVVALDQSAVGLDKARQLAASRGLHIDTLVADLNDYAIAPGHWDGIVSIWCHMPEGVRPAIHARIAQGLKPGGVFVLEAYTPDQIGRGTGGPKTLELLPTLAELRRDLGALEYLHAVERERVVKEGHGHTGLSAVVQVVARRPA